jgi:DNA polymerase-3 subunit delta
MAKARTAAPRSAKQILCIAGSDEAEVKSAAREAAKRLTPADGGDFACDTIDGAADTVDDAVRKIHAAVEALLTLPFFGSGKLVWFKDVNFLGDTVMGRSASVQDALDSLASTLKSGLAPDVRFLLSATELDKRRSFFKTLSALGDVELQDKLDSSRSGWEEQAAQAAAARARAHSIRFQPDALELFALLTGGETRVVESELEKLALYLGPDRSEITIEDVRLLVPPARAGVIFELGNAIARSDINRAITLLRQLMFQGESAIGILLVAIIPTVRNLLLVRDLMPRHWISPPLAPFNFQASLNRLPPEAIAHLPRKKDGTLNAYPLGIAAMHAHRFDPEQLERALGACLEANLRLVTTQLDPEVVLTELILKVVASPGAPR